MKNFIFLLAIIPSLAFGVSDVRTEKQETLFQKGVAYTRRDESSGSTQNAMATATTYVKLASVVSTVNGMAAPVASESAKLIIVSNITGSEVTFVHNAGAATAANRFDLPAGANILIPDRGAVSFIYDSVLQRWVLAAPGVADAASLQYTPAEPLDWDTPAPENAQQAFDEIAERVTDAEGDISGIQSDLNNKVDGPASSTDNAIVRFDNTTGKLVQNSSASLDDAGGITANRIAAVSASGGAYSGVIEATNSDRSLFVKGSSSVTGIGGYGGQVGIVNTDTTPNNMSVISFQDSAFAGTAAVYSINKDQSNHYGELGFLTRDSDGYFERMRLTANGLGLGASNPGTPLDITKESSTANVRITDNTNGSRLRLVSSSVNFDMYNGGSSGALFANDKPIFIAPNPSDSSTIISFGDSTNPGVSIGNGFNEPYDGTKLFVNGPAAVSSGNGSSRIYGDAVSVHTVNNDEYYTSAFPPFPAGIFMVTDHSSGNICIFVIANSGITAAVLADPNGICSASLGTSGKINIEKVGYNIRVENKTGGTLNLRDMFIGTPSLYN